MAIDFDHSHYTIEELFGFFDLNMDEKNVKKLSKVAKKLISNALEEKNEELATFIDKTKTILKSVMESRPDSDSESSESDTEKPKESTADYVFTKELMEGALNPTYKQTFTRLINIDSQYKGLIETNNTNTTNFAFEFTETLSNVTGISLYSLEIPYSWYTFDEAYGTHIFKISDGEYKITSGNYTPPELITEINKAFSGLDISGSIETSSGKTMLTNNAASEIVITFYSETDSAFTDSKTNNNLGWLLGFRKETVTIQGNSSVVSESPIDVWGTRYIYMCLDDFNNNQSTKALIGITKPDNNIKEELQLGEYNIIKTGDNSKLGSISQITTLKTIPNKYIESYNMKNLDRYTKPKPRYSAPVNSNFFAKIPIKLTKQWTNNYSYPYIDFSGPLQKNARDYFGPISITRMKVTLFDDKGNILNLNGLDWSFALQTTHVYQYGTPKM